jgi:hypothetical protein
MAREDTSFLNVSRPGGDFLGAESRFQTLF